MKTIELTGHTFISTLSSTSIWTHNLLSELSSAIFFQSCYILTDFPAHTGSEMTHYVYFLSRFEMFNCKKSRKHKRKQKHLVRELQITYARHWPLWATSVLTGKCSKRTLKTKHASQSYSDARCDSGQITAAPIYSDLTNEQTAFHLCGAWLLSCSHLHSCLKLYFRSEEHLDPPSKALHLTDNCNSLHFRLCLLTSHKRGFALCIVGDLHPPYFSVLRNTDLQCHVFYCTKTRCDVQEAVCVYEGRKENGPLFSVPTNNGGFILWGAWLAWSMMWQFHN